MELRESSPTERRRMAAMANDCRNNEAFQVAVRSVGDTLRAEIMTTAPTEVRHVEAWHEHRAMMRIVNVIDRMAHLAVEEDEG